MNISELYRNLNPISPTGPASPKPGPAAPAGKPGAPSEFDKILNGNLAPKSLSLSSHAETRIKSREIPWDAALEKRISGGIDAAEKKGSRETLILAGDVAVIANVKTRTVVTAMDRSQLKEKVFTNIDSAVLV
jgi:flagellar operon protein